MNILPFKTKFNLSKPYYYYSHQLSCIPTHQTYCITVISIIQSKHDYCNSLNYVLAKSQITRLQQIQHCLARAVIKAPKSFHATANSCCIHKVKITERIEYKLLSLIHIQSLHNHQSFLSAWPHLCLTSLQQSVFIFLSRITHLSYRHVPTCLRKSRNQSFPIFDASSCACRAFTLSSSVSRSYNKLFVIAAVTRRVTTDASGCKCTTDWTVVNHGRPKMRYTIRGGRRLESCYGQPPVTCHKF